MKVRFNFNLQAWIEDVEIEADSYEEAEKKLLKMDIRDLIANGNIQESDLNDIDGNIEERDIKVKVYNVSYDITDSDFEDNGVDPDDPEACAAFEESLPHSFNFILSDVAVGDEDEAIAEEISDRTGWMVLSHVSDYDTYKYKE